ncbi:hypothetical protein M413DRAFT_440122 [Hebeloma cylindrosporum]|uniref:Uncharacterized protein n=1 Tax=Hebeloma cylindrosporum TaxID=76867 RepID=A0A0C3CI25_HEBCY|nr:hypothetical protein M413DRAFT_440122 [Hebeloma cylindrosporum h7]
MKPGPPQCIHRQILGGQLPWSSQGIPRAAPRTCLLFNCDARKPARAAPRLLHHKYHGPGT